MIFGIGTDIIEVPRMEKHLEKSDALVQKLYTKAEQKYCGKGEATKYQCFAARFAAKEAFFKALGTGYRYGMAFHEIEVLNDKLGKPYVVTHGRVKEFIAKNNIVNTNISLSHVKEMAVAFVVIEK